MSPKLDPIDPRSAQEFLAHAAQTNHPAGVARWAAAGADPNGEASSGMSILRRAAQSSGIETLRALLDAGALVDGPLSERGVKPTPLGEAARRGRLDAVELLISRGANVNATWGAGLTALLETLGGHLDSDPSPLCCEALLRAGADPECFYGDASALLYALYVSSEECCLALMRFGADASTEDSRGWTALGACANVGRSRELAQELAALGADPLKRCPRGTPAQIARTSEYFDLADALDALAASASDRLALQAAALPAAPSLPRANRV
jgi:hypothetical protein